jgi:hypothetical protein
LRLVLAAAFPDAVEQVDFGNKLLAVRQVDGDADLTFAIIPHSAHVNLQLPDGVDLPDPDGLIEGNGKRDPGTSDPLGRGRVVAGGPGDRRRAGRRR